MGIAQNGQNSPKYVLFPHNFLLGKTNGYESDLMSIMYFKPLSTVHKNPFLDNQPKHLKKRPWESDETPVSSGPNTSETQKIEFFKNCSKCAGNGLKLLIGCKNP